jgi:subtilisin family serine protease
MADSNILEKLDLGLKTALQAWESEREAADPNAGISVSLRYEGDLAAIEALGFETHMVSQDSALGVVRFKDLPALAAHPGVIWIAAGQRRKADLDTAAREIKARASAPVTGAPVDGLWHVPNAGGALTNAANATGEDVIVAVIDTGIDYKHPMFMSQLTPTKTTRILKIWDQGLTPANVADCPLQARLGSADTYGVEYDKAEIETALNGGAPILHRDCIGHGTHVAGIAAGGPLFPSGGNADLVGVAPKASIIAVKLLDTPEHIFFRLPTNAVGTEVGWNSRFRDAVLYCLRSARTDFGNKPIVINMSFGSIGKPGDGLDGEAVWVDNLMDPAQAADDNHFPTRAIIVKSSGNDGDPTDRQTARIVVPASGEIIVPLRLRDTGGHFNTDWQECAQQPYKPDVGVHFWFRSPAAALAAQFSFRLPNGSTFFAPVSGGGQLEIGFIPLVGPPPTVSSVAASSAVHRVSLQGETPPAVPHPAGPGSVTRQRMHFSVKPKEVGSSAFYHTGIYELRIAAPAGTEIFAICEQEFWNSARMVSFAIATTMQDGTALPAGITVSNVSSSVDSLGRNVITVASYDDLTGDIADSSSRGPLRNFAAPASGLSVIAAKPDIAAPGVAINSARSIDTVSLPPLPLLPPFNAGRRFWEMGGTSMATPMIAGIVALMLHKLHDLNITRVRTALLAVPRSAVNPSVAPASTQAYGAGRVDAITSHSNTH